MKIVLTKCKSFAWLWPLYILLFANASFAQEIIKMEYFVDTDPGFGKGQALPIAPGMDISESFSLPVQDLPAGLHQLYFRALVAKKDLENDGTQIIGGWSHTRHKLFYKEAVSLSGLPSIVSSEYFFGADPGFGKGKKIQTGSPAADLSSLPFAIEIPDLNNGLHTLSLRFKDTEGNWSHTRYRLIVKEEVPLASLPNITQGEYFIGPDPGFGNGITMPVASPGSNLSNLIFGIDVNNLPTGLHSVSPRFKDANHKWSHTKNHLFYKMDASLAALPDIIKGEYFIGMDPGFGNGNPIPLPAQGNDLGNVFAVDVEHLPIGLHSLHIRYQDGNNKWSHTRNGLLYKSEANLPPAKVVKLEYFIDTDPGFGNGWQLPITTPAEDISNFTFPVGLSDISMGPHKLYVRALDENGKWSFTKVKEFEVTAPQPYVVTVGQLNGSYCAGSMISIPYTVSSPFDAGNIFEAQLSDAFGSFANPLTIGSHTSSIAGSIAASIPAETLPGVAYRIRIVASAPAFTSVPNSNVITISSPAAQAVIAGGQDEECPYTIQQYATPLQQNGETYTWELSGGGILSANGNTASVEWVTPGEHTLSVFVTSDCGAGPVANKIIVVLPSSPQEAPVLSYNGQALTSTSLTGSSTSWYKDDVFVFSGDSYGPTENGSYTARFINGCGEGPLSSPFLIPVPVGKQIQSISFATINNKVYGQPSFELEATASSGLPVKFEVLDGPAQITGTTLSIMGVGTVQIEASQEGNEDFMPAAVVKRSFEVEKAVVAIAFQELIQTYDGSEKQPVVITSPLALAYSISIDDKEALPTDAGFYSVKAIITDPNYEGEATENFVIQQAAQEINFPKIDDQIVGAGPIVLAATASSGLPVSYSLSTQPDGIATLFESTLTIHAEGSISITASQEGNDNYLAAQPITKSFLVNSETTPNLPGDLHYEIIDDCGKVKVSWKNVEDANYYEYQFKTKGSGYGAPNKTNDSKNVNYAFTYTEGAHTFITLQNMLTPATDYEFRVRARLNGDFTDWANFTFSTGGTLDGPSNIELANVSNSMATLSWQGIPCALGYEAKIVQKNLKASKTISTSQPEITFDKLTGGTKYIVYVRTRYHKNIYSAWASFEFTTSDAKASAKFESAGMKSNATEEGNFENNIEELNETINLYPVPAMEKLTVLLNMTINQEVKIQVLDLMGRARLRETDVNSSGQGWELNVSQLEAGTYVVRINSGHKVINRRFIKL